MTTTAVPETGPGSTSFLVHAAAFLSGLATTAIAAFAASPNSKIQVVGVAAGSLVALGSTASKLYHDQGIHVATITALGSAVGKDLPTLEALDPHITDVATAEVNKLRGELGAHFQQIDSKIAAIPGAEQIAATVRQVVAQAFQAPATLPAPAPVDGQGGNLGAPA
jgi:hypothetical protein